MFILKEKPEVNFTYTNWKGETGERKAIFTLVYFGTTHYHPEPQWLVEAFDLDKEDTRIFAMKDMSGVVVVPVDEPKKKKKT